MYYSVLLLGFLTLFVGFHHLKKLSDHSLKEQLPVDEAPKERASTSQALVTQSHRDPSPSSQPLNRQIHPLQQTKKVPLSVNYHLTRQCNYNCGFCFHTATTSHVEPLENAQKAMALLKEAGMKKINFAGGEPFLQPRFLGKLARYCKETLQLESVTIVTNGSKVTESWLKEYGQYIDIMAVSCDSFDENTNRKIGRGKGRHLEQFEKLSKMCRAFDVLFKINTVVNKYNYLEDMNDAIASLAPYRWKCFQVLIVPEENGSEKTLRDAREFVITDEQFEAFCARHKQQKAFVPEGNGVMKSSYLLLDEYLCFLNKGVKGKTGRILEVGVEEAMRDVVWDEEGFVERGGIYEWSKPSAACHDELAF